MNFTDISEGEPISWFWDFGDGETSILQNPTHIYSNSGYYAVRLIATDDAGSDVKVESNYIHVYIAQDRIVLNSGKLNGMAIDPSDPAITVPQGVVVSGTLNISVYNAHEPNMLFPVSGTPTWGDRETSHWTVTKHAPSGKTDHIVSVDLTAPLAEGTYYIIIACAAQANAAYIASCTNGGEVWNDGNDVVDWDKETIQHAIEHGYVNVPWLVDGDRYSSDMDTGAVAVKIKVEGRKPLLHPYGLAMGSSGDIIYVADTGNHRVRALAFNSDPLLTWGEYGDGDGHFRSPQDMAVDMQDSIYVADTENHRIQKFSADGQLLMKWGKQGIGDGQFSQPGGVALDSSGNVYVADTGNSRIQKFTPDGVFLAKWGTTGDRAGQFSQPHSLAVDRWGDVYVADTLNHRVQVFSSDAILMAAWGSYGSGPRQFHCPSGIAVDNSGNVYVADTLNHRIQVFSSDGTFLMERGTLGQDEGQLDMPRGIAVYDPDDLSVYVYVADTNNDRTQTWELDKVPNTHVITAEAQGRGNISPPGSLVVDHRSALTFAIAPDPCHHIADVLVDDESVGAVTEYAFVDIAADHTIRAVFEMDTHALTATAGDHGSIRPSGLLEIGCGAGKDFTITPDEGYHVADVLVDEESVGAVTNYTLTNISTDHAIHARFAVNEYTIATTVNGYGSISPSNDVKVSHGSDAAFTITPDPCHQLVDILVDNESVGAVATYTFSSVTSNHTIEAVFVQKTYVITVAAGENGQISASGEISVNCEKDLTLYMTPDEGYHISELTVDGESVSAVAEYTFEDIVSDHSLNIRFAVDDYTVMAAAARGGIISPGGEVKVSHGADLTFEIKPDNGHRVVEVFVDGEPVGDVMTYTFSSIETDHSIEAIFALRVYTIVSEETEHGHIFPSDVLRVEHGSGQTFSITPETCYHTADVLVDGESVGAVAEYVFGNVTSDHTIDAVFERDTYVVTTTAEAHGRILPSGDATVNCGENAFFAIAPDEGYHVLNVTVDGVPMGDIMDYGFEDVDSDHAINAAFEINKYDVMATAGDNGTIVPTTGGTVEHGGSLTFVITPDPCFHVADVLVDGGSVGAVTEYTFVDVTAGHTIEAVFEIDIYTIIAAAGDNGNIFPSGDAKMGCGEEPVFVIEPDLCYRVADVLVDNESVGSVTEYAFQSVESDHTIEAVFEMITYNVTATAGANGSVYPSGSVAANCGEGLLFTIVPDEGYHVLNVMVDDQPMGAVTEHVFEDLNSDHIIHAAFAVDKYNIIVAHGNNGVIVPLTGDEVAYGESATFSITPDPCYHTSDVLVDGESVGAVSEYTFENVMAEHTIEAKFSISSYTITSEAGDDGVISPSGSVTVECGSSRTFSLSPANGCRVADVEVDGNSVGAVTAYTFDNVASNHTIEAKFQDVEPPTGGIVVNGDSQYSADHTVTLEVSAQDTGGIVSRMQFSNDGISYSAWEPYASVKEWRLSAGDGRKTVYAQFTDEAGNQSIVTISDSIVLDTTPPTGSVVINDGDGYCNSVSVSLTLSASDNGSGVTHMKFSNDNSAFSPSEAYSSTKAWILPTGDGTKTVYVRFQDAAGNGTEVTISDSIIMDTTPPEVLDASSTTDTENMPINAPIMIDFSEDIDESSISVSVSGSISGSMSGRTSYQDGTLTFTPDGSFSDKEDIIIEIAALDLAANRIVYSMGFSTGISVWPGDTDRDGKVDILDLLSIGKYWGEKGSPRTPADISWEAQPASPWVKEEATYADADGNGLVDADDVLVVDRNWGKTRSATTAPMVASPGVEELRARLAMLIKSSKEENAPNHSSLGQNYPNPFNPDTWIPYQLAEASDVIIQVYDVSGHLIRTLAVGYKDADMYATREKAVHWDGRNDAGESVSSGIYFYRIKAGNFTDMKKLMVIF